MKKVLIVLLSLIALTILGACIFYNVNLKAVSSDSTKVDFMVDSGSTYYSVISKLKKEGLIRNELCFKLYVKFNKVNDVEAGTYKISKNMSVKDIVNTLSKGNTYNPDAIVITFKEGKHMRSIAGTIAKYTNNTEISAGLTPDILDACPILRGVCAFNFCLASILNPLISS